MKKTIIKLIISSIAFLVVNLWIIYKATAKGDVDYFISPAAEETILFIFLQLFNIFNYFIHPLTGKKQKIIYWCISEALVLITVFVWGIWVIGPIWKN